MTLIFRAKTTNAYNIKILAELLSNNIKVGHFVINKKGIFLKMMDTHRKILISVELLAENFGLYKLKNVSKLYIGLNLSHFHKMLKSIKKKDVLELYIDDEEHNILGIKVYPKENDRVTTSFVTIQSVQEFDIDLPKLESSPITISSSEFQKMIKDMNNIGNMVNIKARNFNIKFTCKTDGILAREVEFGEIGESADAEDNVVLYDQNFFTEQLTRLTKISGLSNNIKIYQGKPILFRSNVDNLGVINIYVKSNEQREMEELDAKNKK